MAKRDVVEPEPVAALPMWRVSGPMPVVISGTTRQPGDVFAAEAGEIPAHLLVHPRAAAVVRVEEEVF